MNWIVASAGNPVTHAVPHAISEEVLSVNVGGGDIPALNIYDGVYRFFITNHLMMSLVSAIAVILVFLVCVAKGSSQGRRSFVLPNAWTILSVV